MTNELDRLILTFEFILGYSKKAIEPETFKELKGVLTNLKILQQSLKQKKKIGLYERL